jgi:hypothetical protein
MTDQDCPIDERVVEDGRDIVGEILDRDTRRVLGRRCSTVSAVMRMQSEPIG